MQRDLKEWLEQTVTGWAASVGFEVEARPLRVSNPLQKPGPVFNAMAKEAARIGATYMYRVNDDTEFEAPWPRAFAAAIEKLKAPFGVIGPACPQGNRNILTHDFTHRLHMDIFEDYYPPVLSDWFMDDWISRVYGQRRTRLMAKVSVTHHTKTYGRRYHVDGTHRHLVDDLVKEGKGRILRWMESSGVDKETRDRFSSDRFDHSQTQKAQDDGTIASGRGSQKN